MNHRWFPVVFALLIASVFAVAGLAPRTPGEEPKSVARIQVSDPEPIQIRLIALKHSHISMADGDAELAMRAVKAAASKGLAIKDVGNHNIDRNGFVSLVTWYENDLDKLKAYVSQCMKIDASPGDTFIIFTIGHGFPDGNIQNMGQRAQVMKAFADAAEENQQKTLWWQLSCYAQAGLPKIESLPEGQQHLFSVLATANSSETSAAGVQGKIMEKVFVALAGRDRTMDPDGSGVVTAGRFRNFLNGISARRGDLLYSISPDEPIFGGGFGAANSLPIVDRSGPQQQYKKGYVPLPGRR